jgi:inorganic pyrophosphatase
VAQAESGVAVAAGLRAPDPYTLVGPGHYIHDYPAVDQMGRVNVCVEIPAGSVDKWEVDKADGSLRWEFRERKPRKVNYLGYPGNYGMVPRTLLSREQGGDGDPLDVLVLGDAVPRGSLVAARIVAVLKMKDDGERDDKLIAVREGTPFASARDLQQLDDQFPGVTRIVETWFENYKGSDAVETDGFGNAGEAVQILRRATQAYEKKAGGR